jgi:hypothetical protein
VLGDQQIGDFTVNCHLQTNHHADPRIRMR